MKPEAAIVRGPLHRARTFPDLASAMAYAEQTSKPRRFRSHPLLLDVWVCAEGIATPTLFCRWLNGERLHYRDTVPHDAVPERWRASADVLTGPPAKPHRDAIERQERDRARPWPRTDRSVLLATRESDRLALGRRTLAALRAKRPRFPLSAVRPRSGADG